MNYQQAVQYLYDLRRFGLKFGLENTFKLAALAGNPQDRLRFIHVAGTNGKGSTCAMLEAIYRAAGFKVGLFTSPHLVSFRERIQVDRRLVDETEVARLVEELGADPSFTFFEAVTIMALKYFDAQRCDLVIWETGLGGRLDATNIVTPLASVITNVQLDHQQWLGGSIPEIAREKAGIIKPGIPVITAAEEPALSVIAEVAAQQKALLTVVGPLTSYEISLPGEHQRLNAAAALATVRTLAPQLPVKEAAIRHGLKETHWAGRLQRIDRPNGQVILIDGAHNPAGAHKLADALSGAFPDRKPAFILGAMADKDCAGICRILAPLASSLFLPPMGSGRSADPRWLAELCRAANPDAPISVCDSLSDALSRTDSEPFVVITGSLHFIGEALEQLGLAGTASERELNEYTAPRTRILAVTLDVGGTLIEPWPSVGHVYADVAARHGISISPETLNRQFAAAWKRKKNFGHSMSDWSNLVDETFAGLMEPPPSKSFFAELYDRFASADAWHVFDDVVPTLQGLRQRGLKVAAISNWDERLRPLLRALDLDRYFDAIIISTEVGCPKPGAAIFQAAAERLGVAPGSILHIGDSQAEDYQGAISPGFQALLLQRHAPVHHSSQINRLTEALTKPNYELPPLCGNLEGGRMTTPHAKQDQVDLSALRADFPILDQKVHGFPLVYLDSAATSQKPRVVLEALTRFYERDNSNVHRGIHELSRRSTVAYEAAREKVAKFLNARESAEIIFTRGSTEAINLVANTWGVKNLQRGDTILLTEMEHHSNIVPWQLVAERTGVRLAYLPVTGDDGLLRLDQLDELLGQNVKLFAFTFVSNTLGTVNPAADLCARARQRGITTLVDAAQAVGHRPVNVQELGCDFLVFSGHKVCGPTGIGALYGRREILEAMPPYQGGGDMIANVDFFQSTWKEVPHKFEAGTPDFAGAVGLHAALDYLDKIDCDVIARHDSELSAYAYEKLSGLRGVRLFGPKTGRSGVLSFLLRGVHAHDVVTVADQRGLALRGGHHCNQPLMKKLGVESTARASFYFYNTKSEVDRLAEVLAEIQKFFGEA